LTAEIGSVTLRFPAPRATRASTNMPGRSFSPAFANLARTRTLRVAGSTTESIAVTEPAETVSVSPSRVAVTS
jgi:hypothetical protein